MSQRIWGLVLLAVGILTLLQGIGYYNFGLAFWPVILVLAGGAMVWGSFSQGRILWILLGLGLWGGGIGLFQILANAGVTGISGDLIFRHGWPILLVALGITMIFGNHTCFTVLHHCGVRPESHRRGKQHGTRWHHIGDLYHGRESWVLDADLDLQHGIGDIVLDLSTASISEGDHHISAGAGIGELLIRVPDHINAAVNASVTLGELDLFGETRSGIGGLSLQQEIYSEDSPVKLSIEARVGIGSLKIILVPASPGASR